MQTSSKYKFKGIVVKKYNEGKHKKQLDINIGGFNSKTIRCTIDPQSDLLFDQILEGDQVKIKITNFNKKIGSIISSTTESLQKAIIFFNKKDKK
jgi:hypothetical protein